MSKLTENIFGLQIRRASDLIGEQGREAFWRTGIELDAKLISIVVALHEQGEQTSSELACLTGLSRQLVESRLRALEDSGYIASKISKSDARKRAYSIARKRRSEVARAVEQMVDFEKVYDALWREIGVDLSDAILRLERALHAKPLLARLCQEYPQYGNLIRIRANEE